jgi:hypothetical protein
MYYLSSVAHPKVIASTFCTKPIYYTAFGALNGLEGWGMKEGRWGCLEDVAVGSDRNWSLIGIRLCFVDLSIYRVSQKNKPLAESK